MKGMYPTPTPLCQKDMTQSWKNNAVNNNTTTTNMTTWGHN